MYYGASYYPEHKNPEDLKNDLQLIKDSGINTVRLGEFAWNFFEPVEGTFEFNWLEKVVNELGEAGVDSILCTPTACPPAWLVEKHPDLLYVDNRGVTRPFGGRRHYCYNNENYRRACAIITEKIVTHFKDNPYVIAYQIDNELAQEGTGRCHCPVCKEKFVTYLEEKYDDIDDFNRRIGSPFWGMEYDSFQQVTPPVNSIEVGAQPSIHAFHENPSIRLEWERFCSNSQIEFQDIQTKILKEHVAVPVTTNATGLATNSIDYYKAFQQLDNYAFDYYPELRDSKVDSFPYAFGRGVKKDKPFWVMEFMSGGGHRFGGRGRLQPNPGALEQSVIHSMAHGAEMMMHFQFRTFPFGAEQLNYAIVHIDGKPRRHYYEMMDTAKALNKLEPLEQAKFPGEVAICFDYDSHWALRIKPISDPVFQYIRHATEYYDALSQLGVNADVISLNADFDQYKAVLIPAGFILTEEQRDKVRAYVKNGGTVLSTIVTSVKNADNIGYTETLPAGLTDVFGAEVYEVEPIYPERNHNDVTITTEEFCITQQDSAWSELLEGDAEFIGKYSSGYKDGFGVVSKNSYGNGMAYYVGTVLESESLKAVLQDVIETAELSQNSLRSNSDQVEIVRRCLDEKEYNFLFNFDTTSQIISLPGEYKDYLTGKVYDTELVLHQNQYIVLEKL